jgi:hypothetical protein
MNALVLVALALPAQGDKKPTFQDHVLPVLQAKCGNCHSPDKKRGGLVVTNYTKLMEGGSSGAVVKPGDPEKSSLFTTVAHKAEPFMPPNSPKIPDPDIALIETWISAGAPENSGSKTMAAAPKKEIGLKSVVRGRPSGPPPMPSKPLAQEPVVKARRANPVTAIASNPWSPLVAVGAYKQILLYNGDSQELLGVLPFPEGLPTVIKFSRNGGLLMVAGGRGSATGKVTLFNVATGERITSVGEETDTVLAADVSPDQSLIALGGPSKMLRVYNTADGKLAYEVKKHTDWITSLEFSPDGVLLATGDRSSGLFVWEAHNGREYFTLRGHTAAVTEVSWRQDSNILLSASEDTTIRQWEMENGNQVKSWAGHGGGTLGARYGMDGRIVSAGRDRTVKLWDGNGAALRTFEAMPDLTLRALLTHDGARVIGTDWTGQVRAWNAADGRAEGSMTANPGTLTERMQLAAKELEARQASAVQLAAQAKQTEDALKQAGNTIAEVQGLQKTLPAQLEQAKATQAKAKAAKDSLTAAKAQLETEAKGRETVLAEMRAMVARLKDQVQKAPMDKAMPQAATRAQAFLTQLEQEAAPALAKMKELEPKLALETKAQADADAQVAALTAQVAGLPKRLTDSQAAQKALGDQLKSRQTAAQQAQADLLRLQGIVERLKSRQSTVSAQPAKPAGS